MNDEVIVLTGAGSGGHITPVIAVAAELKQQRPAARLVYIGQTGDLLGDIPAQDPNIDEIFTVRAGKFRRYHGEGFKQLLDWKTIYLNIRDVFNVIAGFWQSRKLLKQLRPKVIFIKGGFVGMPIGLAAATLKIPYITHDSDPIPGLANRIIARWAKIHAVALPKEIYHYPQDKTVTTGIPLQSNFTAVTPELQKQYRKELDLPEVAKVLFIIGGGLGSQRVNMAVLEIVPHLLAEYPDLYVVHGVGRANELDMQTHYDRLVDANKQGRVRVFGFANDVYRYSGAADLIITRAGATNLAEFAVQGKACIVVPSPFLTGGHQLKGAQILQDSQAAAVIDEADVQADPNRLARLVSDLIKDPAALQTLRDGLSKLAQPEAAQKLAALIIEQMS